MSNEVLKKAVDLLSDELSEYVEAERLRGMLRSVGMSENDIAELGWGEKGVSAGLLHPALTAV